ncbi:hypothetical protein [Alteromonas sp. KUL49]|uniref:hypothetical protein n=1 Tax=Alteromonas sp. KUL49 TaxID=2480798 RepID=UPI0010D88CA1|nr:hypothetical protein [Alteromonas sp. KUL49]TAP40941.1 hypothetical protein EYS00_07495 [Alteromonas sp. KUL49]GEA11123.1 hypothetical protein KUL49_14980 [Alteromonas sp. KUL49]
MTLLILLAFFGPGDLHTIQFGNCSSLESEFISTHFARGNLNSDNLVDRDSYSAEHQLSVVCSLRNALVLDGLSFTLESERDAPNLFISVRNGLDGSSKTYGPFISYFK